MLVRNVLNIFRAGFPGKCLKSQEIMLTQTLRNTQQSELLFCSLHCKIVKTKGNNGPSSKLLLGNLVATQYNCQADYIIFANFMTCQ